MGIEIVFVLILPIAALCFAAAALLWSRVVKVYRGNGQSKAYIPLLAGFFVSMIGLAVLVYIECDGDFTSLVQQGYYTEAERAMYLPSRVVGQAIVELVFVLPVISFVVVPLTTRLIRRGGLTLKAIGLLAVVGWFALSVLGWTINLTTVTHPYSLVSFLESTAIPVVLYALPIPVAAILLRPRENRA